MDAHNLTFPHTACSIPDHCRVNRNGAKAIIRLDYNYKIDNPFNQLIIGAKINDVQPELKRHNITAFCSIFCAFTQQWCNSLSCKYLKRLTSDVRNTYFN